MYGCNIPPCRMYRIMKADDDDQSDDEEQHMSCPETQSLRSDGDDDDDKVNLSNNDVKKTSQEASGPRRVRLIRCGPKLTVKVSDEDLGGDVRLLGGLRFGQVGEKKALLAPDDQEIDRGEAVRHGVERREVERTHVCGDDVESHKAMEPSGLKTGWYLVDTTGQLIPLPGSAVSVGSGECDLQIQSHGVESRHAVLTFDPSISTYIIKDLSTSGTLVNGERIAVGELAILHPDSDTVSFGTDPMEYTLQCHRADSAQTASQGTAPVTGAMEDHHNVTSPGKDAAATAAADWMAREAGRRLHPHVMDKTLPECPGCAAELRHRGSTLEDYQHLHYSHYQPPDPTYPRYTTASIHYNTSLHTTHSLSQAGRPAYTKWHGDVPYHHHPYPVKQPYAHPIKTPEQLKEVDPFFQKAAASDNVEAPHGYIPPGVYPHDSIPHHYQRSHGGHYPVGEGEDYGPPHRHHEQTGYPQHYIPHMRASHYPGPHHLHPYCPPPFEDYPPHLINRGYTAVVPKDEHGYIQEPHTAPVSTNVLTPPVQSIDVKTGAGQIESDIDGSAQCDKTSDLAPVHSLHLPKVSQSHCASNSEDSKHLVTSPGAIGPVSDSATTDVSCAVASIVEISSTLLGDTGAEEADISPSVPVTTEEIIKRSQEFIQKTDEVIQRSDEVILKSEGLDSGRRDSTSSTEEEKGQKGSSLYGQPAWWGQEDANNDYSYPHTATLTGKVTDDITSPERPSTLPLPESSTANSTSAMEAVITASPSDAFSVSGNGSHHAALHTPPERDPGPGNTEPADKPSAMAFTISFGEDENTDKKKAPLSQFLPHKVRKNFRQREKEKRESMGSRESSAERNHQSSRDPSPAYSRKSKSAAASPSTPRRRVAGYHSDGHHSNASSEAEDSSVAAESNTTKDLESFSRYVEGYMTMLTENTSDVITAAKSPKTPQSTRLVEKRPELSPTKRPSAQSKRTPGSETRRTTNTEASTKSTSRLSAVPTKAAEKRRKAVATNSSYLIEKMLNPVKPREEEEENTEEVEEDLADVEPSPEHDLYREARTYDKKMKKGHIVGSSVSRPTKSEKVPVKSTSSTHLMPPADDSHADNVSESGTYTIEVHKDISEARESISKVFGVEDAEEEVTDFDVVVGPHEGLRHLEASQKSAKRLLEGTQTAKEELNGQQLTGQGGTKWLNQWVSPKKPGAAAPVLRLSQEDADVGAGKPLLTAQSQKPPYVPSRRSRAGSGRKLPSPPETSGSVITNQPTAHSPHTTQTAAAEAERDTDSPGRQRATITYDTDEGGFFTVSFDAPVRQSSVPRDEEALSAGRSPVGSPAVMRKDHSSSPSSNEQVAEISHTSRSAASIHSKLLLASAESALESVKKRSSHRRPPVMSNGQSSIDESEPPADDKDSDSSTSGVVERRWGRDRVSTPPNRKTPESKTMTKSKRPAYGKSISVDPRNLSSPQSSQSPVKERKKSAREEYFSQLATRTRQTSSTKRDMKDRDRHSVEYSESESVVSTSTDYSEAATTSPRLIRRTSSGGKGNITITRPNRAFALRRAKTDVSEGASDASTITPKSSRPNSASKAGDDTSYSRSSVPRSRSTSRTRPSSAHDRSQKTEVGSGRVGQKNRDLQRTPVKSTTPTGVSRTDTGRSSFGKSGKGSAPSSASSVRKSAEFARNQVKPPASASRSNSSNTSGVSGAPNRPAGQAESPRSQEYSAWQRRKKYDPRKAAANAKATTSSPKKAMRSKSATEADEVKKPVYMKRDINRSVSSISSEECGEVVHDLSGTGRVPDILRMSAAVTSNMEAMMKATESDDDDDIGRPRRDVQSFRSSLSSDINRSAFSVPKSKSSPSPPPLAGGTRRAFSVRQLLQEETNSIRRHESYDTLIVSSIHQLSQKIKSHTNNIATKLRERNELQGSPSPVSDLLNHDLMSCTSDITGWKSANQELAAILRNLRSTEQQLSAIGSALHCDNDSQPPVKARSKVKSDYIFGKTCTTGFQPIEKPLGTASNASGHKRLPKQSSRDSDNSDQLTGSDYY